MKETTRVSIITGKKYNIYDVVYITNFAQLGAYINNGGGKYLLDIVYDITKPQSKKLAFVFPRNEHTYDLFKKWERYELDY